MGFTWASGLRLGMGSEWAFKWASVGPHMGIPHGQKMGIPLGLAHMGTRWAPTGLYSLAGKHGN